MKIVVASANPAKIKAVEDAFMRQFPGQDLDIESLDIPSGVSDQPVGDEETRRGALNRAARANELRPDADFCVGLEGGIETIDDNLMAYAWMAVRGGDGRVGEARTVTLPLPERVKRLVEGGMELGAANDRVFSTVNSKQKGGAFGLLTAVA